MENAYIIQGGVPLKGEIKLSGAKNVALKVLIAGLLFKKPVHLQNIPRIKDIEELMRLIRELGGKAEFTGENSVVVDGTKLKRDKIDLLYGSKIRVSFMFFAPLLHLFGKAKIPNPGGCRLGARPIDRQIDIMKAMGINVVYNSEDGYYTARFDGGQIIGTNYHFAKATHTGTEFAILLAVLAQGKTVIENAALEPEIDDLINFLNEAGAKIQRKKETIFIDGVKELIQHKPYKILNDRNEAVTFASFAYTTQGDITVEGLSEDILQSFISEVKNANGGIESQGDRIRFFYKGPLKPTHIMTQPQPGFMTDWQGPWAIMMTQAEGTSTIHETIFENRFSYVDELRKLGAKIEFYAPEVEDPKNLYQFNWREDKKDSYQKQGIRIYGKTKLHNGVLDVWDLRAGATLLIAAASAAGETVINGASVIDRGYEHIDHKLRQLGLKIKKV